MKLKPKKKSRKMAARPRALRDAGAGPLVAMAIQITDEALALAEEEAGSVADLEAVARVRVFLRERIQRKPAAIDVGDHQIVIGLLKAAIEHGRDVDQFASITLVALMGVAPRLPPTFHKWTLPVPALGPVMRRVPGRASASPRATACPVSFRRFEI